ncbi:HalOD1 output domain-containing protein [Natrinema marinum]|uniref:HalOD1 output domain-containing protein n=1 Tax=Natrinema marinum TaxID=2961598 RepID=UPI0020C86911|nr:HalOD1 output domain-containing protein [Natrinema marinum]
MPSTSDSPDEPESRDQRYVTTFDPADERPSEAVVTAVAAVLEAEPETLSPLYDIVDPDALNSLVDHAQRAGTNGTHLIWFTYEGLDVGVRSDGQIRIRDATAAS